MNRKIKILRTIFIILPVSVILIALTALVVR